MTGKVPSLPLPPAFLAVGMGQQPETPRRLVIALA